MLERAEQLDSNPLRLLEASVPDPDPERDAAFAALRRADGVADDIGRYPKHFFLRFLVENEGLVLHGSNRRGVERFEPQEQGDFAGRPVRAVFATDDEVWPIYFAVVNRAHVNGLINGCTHVDVGGRRRSRYVFAVGGNASDERSWTEGSVYALPRASFVQQRQPREWLSPFVVEPVLEVPVAPEDFPFLSSVLSFRPGETPARVILRQAASRWLRR